MHPIGSLEHSVTARFDYIHNLSPHYADGVDLAANPDLGKTELKGLIVWRKQCLVKEIKDDDKRVRGRHRVPEYMYGRAKAKGILGVKQHSS